MSATARIRTRPRPNAPRSRQTIGEERGRRIPLRTRVLAWGIRRGEKIAVQRGYGRRLDARGGHREGPPPLAAGSRREREGEPKQRFSPQPAPFGSSESWAAARGMTALNRNAAVPETVGHFGAGFGGRDCPRERRFAAPRPAPILSSPRRPLQARRVSPNPFSIPPSLLRPLAVLRRISLPPVARSVRLPGRRAIRSRAIRRQGVLTYRVR